MASSMTTVWRKYNFSFFLSSFFWGGTLRIHKVKSIHHSKLQTVLFVCTHNINKMFCILNKENKQGLDLEQEHFTKTEPKLSKYLPHWHNNIFIECYKILLYNEIINNPSNLILFYFYLFFCFVLFCFLGRCAKTVLACSTNTLQRHLILLV